MGNEEEQDQPGDEGIPEDSSGDSFGEARTVKHDRDPGAEQTIGGAPTVEGAELSTDELEAIERWYGDERTVKLEEGRARRAETHQPGDIVGGHYEIVEPGRRGGMGVVYKARDTKLGRTVALKRILTTERSSKVGEARFLKEASAIASLDHPNIVRIYDIEEDELGQFIVMEWVEGDSLRDHIRRQPDGKLWLNEAKALAKDIGQALAYAHSKGVIHRDVKPSNILLRSDAVPKLVDFGLARMASESELSKSGYGMGTLDYMPPEQRRDAKNVDHRADIYAFGATLYEMVTGRTPRTVRESEIPAGLQLPILKAMEEEREKRYFAVREMLGDIERATTTREAAHQESRYEGQFRALIREHLGRRDYLAARTFCERLVQIARGDADAKLWRRQAEEGIAEVEACIKKAKGEREHGDFDEALSTLRGIECGGSLGDKIEAEIGRAQEAQRLQHQLGQLLARRWLGPRGWGKVRSRARQLLDLSPQHARARQALDKSGTRIGLWIAAYAGAVTLLVLLALGIHSLRRSAIRRAIASRYDDLLGAASRSLDEGKWEEARSLYLEARALTLKLPAGLTPELVAGLTEAEIQYLAVHGWNTETQLVRVAEDEGLSEREITYHVHPVLPSMRFVYVPGADLAAAKQGRAAIVGPFLIGACEVTQAEWEALMGHNPGLFRGLRWPVEQVSGYDVMAFCRVLSEALGADVECRLPTEVEWEYACRAGSTTPFSCGDRLPQELANYGQRDTGAGTIEVGRYPANAWGLYDMHGNVWEWSLRTYWKYPLDASVTKGEFTRSDWVLRGGSWFNSASSCESSRRKRARPELANSHVGFRVVVLFH